jgi:aryl-alcohol dehydrogenase-like predicted oxidoreductase
MQQVPLGSTGLHVSRLAFGAGPVSALMTSVDSGRQRDVVRRALELGINWFDTAATYGDGRSESSLGAALSDLDAAGRVHVATKVRLMPEQLDDIRGAVRASFESSLERLRLPRVTLLQLHNSVTAARGDEPTSLAPHDVLGPGGVLDCFAELQREGRVAHLGLTGIGQPAALREVIHSGRVAAIQLPYNVLNPSAGRTMPVDFAEADYGHIIADCADRGMAVFPIRVFAGGALARRPPSAHTYKTKFFPLDLYERDVQRAEALRARLAGGMTLEELAVRFTLSHPQVTSSIVGFGAPDEVEAAARWCDAGPLGADEMNLVEASLSEA